ncbi:hypothetical protein ACP4OV_027904 [Aristida adscensionis]
MVAARVREIQHDFATLLDLLPVADLGLADDIINLVAFASRQCCRVAAVEHGLKATMLYLSRSDHVDRHAVLCVEPEVAAHRGCGARRRLAAAEVPVGEVEDRGGGELAEPLGRPGERAGSSSVSCDALFPSLFLALPEL